MNAQSKCLSGSSTERLKCELITTLIDDSEQISYTTYGVCIKDGSDNILITYSDISTNQNFVSDFIRLIMDNDVAAIHIPDLLEDYLDQ